MSYLPSGLKAKNQGFTLIELLIVVIIVGILAAIAIPSLLAQVGKARESEAKKTLGAINRSQQAYFSENGDFATSFEQLEITTPIDNYYTYSFSSTTIAVGAIGKDNRKYGTRSYVSSTQYALETRTFDSILCRGKTPPNYNVNNIGNTGIVNNSTSTPLTCSSSSIKVNP